MIDIRTSISTDEHLALAELAQGRCVLECGTNLGYSAIAMAQLAQCIWTVDRHKDWRLDTLAGVRHSLSLYGVRDKVVLIVGEFADVLPNLPLGWFTFGFLDGFDGADEVARNVELMDNHLTNSALLAVHDYDCAAVQIGLARVHWRRIRLVNRLVVLERA